MRSLKLFGIAFIMMNLSTMVFAQQMPIMNTSNVFSGNFGASWLFEKNAEIICVGYEIFPRQFYVAKLNQNGDTLSMVKTPYALGPVGNNNPWQADMMPNGDIIILASEQIAGGIGNLRVRLTRLEQGGSTVFDSIYSMGVNGFFYNAYTTLMRVSASGEIYLFGDDDINFTVMKLDGLGNFISSFTIPSLFPSHVVYEGNKFFVAVYDATGDLKILTVDEMTFSYNLSGVVASGTFGGLIALNGNILAVLDYDVVHFLDKTSFMPIYPSVALPQNLFISDFKSYQNFFLILSFQYDSINAKRTTLSALDQGGIFFQQDYVVGNDDYPQGFLQTSWGLLVVGFASGNNLFTISFSATTSVAELENSEFSVFPNPSNGEFFILTGTQIEYEVFDQLGSLVQRGLVENRDSIHLKGPGVFFLRTSLGLPVKKLVVQ